MRDLTREIFLELLRSYHDGIGVTHSARPQIEVAGHLAKEAGLMAVEFNAVTELGFAGESECKSFDITKHEFGGTIQHFESDSFEISLYCVDGFRHIELYKNDIIAIAKALGVTAEDLK